MSRILLYDIETAPNVSYTWGKYEQNVITFKQEWYLLCFAYKWLGEKKVHTVALPDFKSYAKQPHNDYHVTKRLHELFNEADVIVAHNGDQFDQKKAHARFIYHQLPPPSPYKQLDTKKLSKRYFSFNSNKLDDIGQHLQLGRKLETGGFDLWLGCMAGNKKSWATMLKYNKQDVALLEKVYLRLRPWVENHPSISLIDGRPEACPKCGKGPLIKSGFKYNVGSVYQAYQCKSCGGYCRYRLQEKVTKPEFV